MGQRDASSLPTRAWPYILVALGVLGVGVAAWRPVPAGVWHDDGVYMLVGKALAGGHGLTYEGVVGSPPAAKFPPLYPGFLGLLWVVLGGAGIGAVTMAATVLNLAFLAIAAGLFAKALNDTGSLSLRASLVVAGLAFVSTDVLRAALVPLSESVFLVFVMGAFALWQRAQSDEGRSARVWLAAVLAAAVATRSAGLAVVAAFAVALFRRRDLKTAVSTVGPALLVFLAWTGWSSNASARIADGTRDLLGPYGSWLVEQTVTAPVAFLVSLPRHGLGVAERIAVLFLPGLSGTVLAVAALPALAIALIGLRRAGERVPPLAWLVSAYVAMLLLWPYLDRRLLVPLHPFIVATVALGAVSLLERLAHRRARVALVALAVTWGAAYSVVSAARIARDWPVAPYRLRSERLAAAVEALSRTAPPEAVIGAPEYWAALHLHGGWTVSPSVRFDPRNVDPETPLWGTADEQIALWQSVGIDHLLLEQAGTLHGAALDKLEEDCPGTVFVLAQSPPQIVVRIDWDSTCTT